ncbi:DUF1559 family PulG-like putative transporter [Allorhodopirellula heiligendammensis]|uniref:DUF1559 domain-containing protein n=1 Tax=Allorhodopirellula heiligendammensis TaxID=2714739 RepID=A0A5C6C2Y7_9BACT|nr:DUF1559 domain-containing protein [Allorhodopirellula heiligendammensis]TWU18488.1 hypothetical protein Poly21_06510 [Allorhodopirellula heiligendammensis]
MKLQTLKTPLIKHATCVLMVSLLWQAFPASRAPADDPAKSASASRERSDEVLRREDDGWKEYDSPRGRILHRALTVYPAAESSTHDSIRLLPKSEEMRDANAAIWYIKALGFLEQTAARQAIERFQSEQTERMWDDINFEPAPWSWLRTPPDQLPIEEVNNYLVYSNFQRELLHRAARCRNFDLDRNIHEVDDVVGFLLPEIQALRQLGRHQSLRCRVAIAEGEYAIARTILGENFQLARHLSDEPFLVSTLVGSAIAQSSFEDAIYLLGEPDSPNLYWAIAELPNPLIDQRRGVELETNLLFQQVRPLDRIDDDPITDIDWADFLNQIMPMIGDESEIGKRFKSTGVLGVSLYIATAEGEVNSYLRDECDLTPAQIDALPVTQAFFLAMRRMYESASHEANHLYHAPGSAQASMIRNIQKRRERISQQYPTLDNTIQWIIPDFARSVVHANWRLQQRLAILQIIEALRDHLATHASQWPERLSDMALPCPDDPVTGEPLSWLVENEFATLEAAFNGLESLRIRLEVGLLQSSDTETPPAESTAVQATSNWQTTFEVDDRATWNSAFSDDVLGLLSPAERSFWQAIQRGVSDAIDNDSGGSKLLSELWPGLPASSLDNSTDMDGALQPGLGAIAEFPIRWVVALPRALRAVFAETHPTLGLGSPDSQSLDWVKDVEWLAIGVDPDQGTVKAIIQCQNDDTAKSVRSQMPNLMLALYRKWVDPQADVLPETEPDLFVSEITSDQVTFFVGGTDQDPNGLVRLIRMIHAGFQGTLNSRLQSKMSTLMLAVHNYHSAFNRLPPFAQNSDPAQRRGLSWRVYLLPFIGDGEYVDLYQRFHLDEPWDSEHNFKLLEEIPDIYQSPTGSTFSRAEDGRTTLLAPANEKPFLGGENDHAFRQILDGLSNTAAIVEVRPELAVPWTKPEDYAYDNANPTGGLNVRAGSTVIGLGDGWAGAVPIDQGDETWRALFTIDGREQLNLKHDSER